MPQFDVHKDRKGALYTLLLDVQADLLSHLDTRVVVPLAPRRRYPARPMRIVNPVLVIGSVASHRTEVVAALDFMFTGR